MQKKSSLDGLELQELLIIYDAIKVCLSTISLEVMLSESVDGKVSAEQKMAPMANRKVLVEKMIAKKVNEIFSGDGEN